MPTVLFEISLFSPGDDKPDAERDLSWLLEALTQRNMGYLRNNPNTPHLYRSGVKYIRPAQMLGEPMEAAILRRALNGAANQPEVAAVLEQVAQVFGGERFRDIGKVIENGGGDCFPIGSLTIRREGNDHTYTPAGELQRGDYVWGRGRWSEVRAVVSKGLLPIDAVTLSNNKSLRLTRDHKVFVTNAAGNVARIAVGRLEAGMTMLRPAREEWGKPERVRLIDPQWAPFDGRNELPNGVLAVERDVGHVACVDIETDDHYVYLPEPDVYVSQCDNLAAWRAAELRQAGIPARAKMTVSGSSGKGTTYHAIVLWPPVPGTPYETDEDPSLLLGMSQPARWADRQKEIAKNQERSDNLRRARSGSPIDRALAEISAASTGRGQLDAIEQELMGGAQLRRKASR